MMKLRRLAALSMAAVFAAGMAACASNNSESKSAETSEQNTNTDGDATYTVGICNYVDDASLNQIVKSIKDKLAALGEENNVVFDVREDNCMGDANVMNQIISNFIADDVDLMVGVATPVAMAMQSATEDNQIPVVFAAVSDPVSVGLVEDLEKPGANITGSSDYLDTTAIMNLILAENPDIKTVGLLYDVGQDSSKTPIAAAKEYLDEKNIAYKEYNGTTVDEVQLAVQSIIADGIEAVFTPSDNTIMTAELSIYEDMANAGVKHYGGADSFALNGAFVGYGVDYVELGEDTAEMIKGILVDGNDPAETPVLTFDNGTATVNTDICEIMGIDYDELAKTFEPYCTKVEPITTAESFEE